MNAGESDYSGLTKLKVLWKIKEQIVSGPQSRKLSSPVDIWAIGTMSNI